MKDPNFFEGFDPIQLKAAYGSPLMIYNERIFRTRCREMKNLVSYPNFSVNYSVKANSNLTLLKIAHEEGLWADAMSPGEIFVEEKAGFKPEEILFITNNVDTEEMRFGVERGITLSIDSVSQLERYGKNFPGTKVALRINSGVGAGHSAKVVTGGHHTKFAILPEMFDEVDALCEKYDLTICGLNQHIGSFVLEEETYLEGVRALLALAPHFKNLEFIDLGGGFGMPYDVRTQKRLDLKSLGEKLTKIMTDFGNSYKTPTGELIKFKIEPGRYISAESCIIAGTVTALKDNGVIHYCGTDIGFNVLIRPMLYGSYHEIETLPVRENAPVGPYTVVGNICESGDILAEDRMLPAMEVDDTILVHDAGAYGYVMSSNYNNRLRPCEIMISGEDGDEIRVIRRRDTLEDLLRNFE